MRNIAIIALAALLAVACEQASPPSAAPAPFTLPEPESAGAQLVMAKCVGCHAVPRPGTHSREEWLGIVHRMQNYRVVKGYGGMLEPELKRVIEYLQHHAKQ